MSKKNNEGITETRRYQKDFFSSGIMLLLSICTNFYCGASLAPAHAQALNWDTKARERSQNLTSRAQNILVKYQTIKGGLDQAVSILLEATRADSTDPLPHTILGIALNMKGRHEEALDALNRSYRLDPKRVETLLAIGFTQYQARDFDKAISAWNTILSLDPNVPQVHANLGFAYMRKGDFERAIKFFRMLTKTVPSSHVAYQGIALTSYLEGDLKQCKQAASYAQSIAPYPPVVLLQAKAAFIEGDRLEGMRLAQQYNKLTKKPFVERSMCELGFSKQHDFRWDPFLADNFDNGYLLMARTVTPKEASKRKSYCKQGKLDQVLSTAKEKLSEDPQDFYLLREVGLLQLASGNNSEAAEIFKTVVTACPSCHIDLLHAGIAFAAAGQPQVAASAVKRYEEMFPDQTLSPAMTQIANTQPPNQLQPPPQAQQPQQSAPPEKGPGF